MDASTTPEDAAPSPPLAIASLRDSAKERPPVREWATFSTENLPGDLPPPIDFGVKVIKKEEEKPTIGPADGEESDAFEEEKKTIIQQKFNQWADSSSPASASSFDSALTTSTEKPETQKKALIEQKISQWANTSEDSNSPALRNSPKAFFRKYSSPKRSRASSRKDSLQRVPPNRQERQASLSGASPALPKQTTWSTPNPSKRASERTAQKDFIQRRAYRLSKKLNPPVEKSEEDEDEEEGGLVSNESESEGEPMFYSPLPPPIAPTSTTPTTDPPLIELDPPPPSPPPRPSPSLPCAKKLNLKVIDISVSPLASPESPTTTSPLSILVPPTLAAPVANRRPPNPLQQTDRNDSLSLPERKNAKSTSPGWASISSPKSPLLDRGFQLGTRVQKKSQIYTPNPSFGAGNNKTGFGSSMEIQSIGILPPPMLGSPKEMNDTEENGNISQGEEGEQKDGEKTLEPNPELNEEEGSKSGEEKTQEETDDLEKKLSEDSGNSPSEGSLLGSEENVNEKSRRQMVLQEILKTEQEYVRDLNVIISVFQEPLRADKDQLGVTDIEVTLLFSNVAMLKPLHVKFCEDLEVRFNKSEASGEDAKIGDVFITLSSFFKMYMQYCSNYPHALKHQEQMVKNIKVAQWFYSQEAEPQCKMMVFGSWLIKPVQRLCKYPLLLRELLSHSPEGHPDHESIRIAKEKIDEVVDAVNEGKRLAERQMKIIEIQHQMDGLQEELVTPSRRFVREGETEVRHKITGKGENRYLFLFNDLVVIARAKGSSSRYEFRKALLWEDCRFIVISEQGKVKHGFEIAHQGQRYIFSCETKKEQDEWVDVFKMMNRELKLKKLEQAKKKK